MNTIVRGTVLKYGDNINTDIISPPQYMELNIEDASCYAMCVIDPNFYKKAGSDKIIVAGENFGSGSSRETAPLTIKYLGISCIVAKFFARIFYRNAINLGMVLIECDEAHKMNENDEIEVDIVKGEIKNHSKQEVYSCSKIPPHIMELISDGGLVLNLQKHLK